MKTNIEGNNNIVAGSGSKVFVIPDEKREQGVIEEIFQMVLDKIETQQTNKAQPERLVHTLEKIQLNFFDIEEQQEVKCYFTASYNKISLIERYFETLENEDQNDIHNYAFLNYCELKTKFNSQILILRELFKVFIPDSKDKNPQYVNIANAIVLFFFDDCTIFEKTQSERIKQISLFDDL